MMPREPWEAEITPAGWLTWHISPCRGIIGMRYGYVAFGTRAHAERKARRIIARLERRDARIAASWTVR